MMLNMPQTLAEIDAARAPQSPAAATERSADGESAHPFARLMAAGEPADVPSPQVPAIAPGEDGTTTAPEEALTEALIAAIESGKIVPPAGEALPPGHLIRGPGGLSVDPQAADDAPLTRMIDMLRALQGFAMPPQPGADGEMPLAGLDLKNFEPADPTRLLSTALGAQAPASAPVTAAAATTPATPQVAATPPTVPIAVAPGRPDWSEAVGQRVLWMVSHKTQAAELRLNPPELGPVEVKIRTDEDGVRLSFAAGNAGVREALESAAPRLREMFLAEGLRLENMDIGQRHAGGDRGSEPGGAVAQHAAAGEDGEVEAPARAALAERAGLVDCFV